VRGKKREVARSTSSAKWEGVVMWKRGLVRGILNDKRKAPVERMSEKERDKNRGGYAVKELKLADKKGDEIRRGYSGTGD